LELITEYSAELGSVAYIGDDIPDIPCMEVIKEAGGMVLCPSDAIPEIKSLSDYISGFAAGHGAVRDCINYLVSVNRENRKDRID
jgi:3-deoxy-D-manno-octulosonate 8-phosphate phosphatase (KDO 8-P phosphatase)